MQITATETFLDGEDRFEAGHTYEVEPRRGGNFVSHGWATSPDLPGAGPGFGGAVSATTLPGPVVLEPDDAYTTMDPEA